MRVVSMDIATNCGVAFGSAGATPRAWSVDLGKGAADPVRFAKAIGLANWLCEEFKPDLVAIEAPVGGPKTSHLLVGMWACAMGEVKRHKVNVVKCDISTVRKHFLGKHLTAKHFPGLTPAHAKREIKRAVMNRCKTLGWPVENDDAADAAAIFDYACAVHHPTHHTTTIGGLFDERKTL